VRNFTVFQLSYCSEYTHDRARYTHGRVPLPSTIPSSEQREPIKAS
jgi:hypothetical protein